MGNGISNFNVYGGKTHGQQGERERLRRLRQVQARRLRGPLVSAEARAVAAGLHVPPPLFDPKHVEEAE